MCFNCFACIIHRLALDLWLAKALRLPAPVILKKNLLKITVILLFVSLVQSDGDNFPVMEIYSDVEREFCWATLGTGADSSRCEGIQAEEDAEGEGAGDGKAAGIFFCSCSVRCC